MADEGRMGWLGEVAEAAVETAIPPEELLRQLREAAPPVASQGGPLFSFEPFRSEASGMVFTIRNIVGKGEGPRLEGVIEPTPHGCLIRYQVRGQSHLVPLLIAASAFALLIPLGLIAVAGPTSLFFYVFVVPTLALIWYLVPFFQRMSARRTLAFFSGLIERRRLSAPAVPSEA